MTNSIKSSQEKFLLLHTLAEFGVYLAVLGYIFSTALLQIGVYLSIASWMLLQILNKKGPIPHTPLNRMLLIVLISLIVSVVVNPFHREGIQGLHKWVRGILFFGISYQLFQSEQFERKVKMCIALAFVVVCIDGLWQYHFGKDFLRGYGIGYADLIKRVTSSFGYFGMFASYLLMAGPIALASTKLLKNQKLRVMLFGILIVIGSLNLYLTRTRGAWVTAIAMIIIFLLIRRKFRWISLVLASSVVIALLLPKDLLFHSKKASGIDKTVNHRIELWNEAVNIIKAKPILGTGLNAYVKNISIYNPTQTGEVKNYYAHNGYLQHTAETGMLGLFAFLAILGQGWFLIWRKKIDFFGSFTKQMLFLSICGFLFYMFFDTIFHNMQPFIFFWLLLGWCLAPKVRTSL